MEILKRIFLLTLFSCLPAFAGTGSVEYISLNVQPGSPERVWRDALAKKLNGRTEVVVPCGRIDVMTTNEVFELDFVEKWHEGLGQAIHYADATGMRGGLALIFCPKRKDGSIKKYLRLFDLVGLICVQNNIDLVVLFP